MSRPSKKIVAWLESAGFVKESGHPVWTRRVPPREDTPGFQINRSEITVVYHRGFKRTEIDPSTGSSFPGHPASWELKTEVHADKFMSDVEDDVLDELTNALVWQDQNLVIWPDEERASHRDEPGGFDGYGLELPPPRKLVQLSWEPDGECDFPGCGRTAYAFTLEGAEGYTVACSQHARQMYEEESAR